ncbi:MAG: ATP-binding protein [Vicinamibacterales bacterium]
MRRLASPFRTLTAKLALSYVLLSLALNAVLVVVLSIALSGGLQQGLDTFLMGFADGFIESDPPTLSDVEEAGKGIADGEGLGDGFCIRFVGVDGVEVFSAGLEEANALLRHEGLAADVPVGDRRKQTLELPGGGQLRVVTRRYLDGSTLQMGARVVQDAGLRTRVLQLGFAAVAVLSLLAASIGWLVARRAMGGVRRVTVTAQEIMDGALDLRVPVEGAPGEVADLAVAFNRMLERIERLVEDVRRVSADMVHDLRSPLTRMRAQAEYFLRDSGGDDKCQELAEKTIEETLAMERFIDETLEVIALDTGLREPQLQDVELCDLVRNIVDLFEPVIEAEGARVRVAIQGDAHVSADPDIMRRVVSNILDNAIKFNANKGLIIVTVESGGKTAVVSIADSGRGIPKDERAKVFERFYRVEQSRGEKGHGLGLSYVDAAVRAMNGTVEIRDSDLGGAEVRVALQALYPSA